jgi:hypothetical protein
MLSQVKKERTLRRGNKILPTKRCNSLNKKLAIVINKLFLSFIGKSYLLS